MLLLALLLTIPGLLARVWGDCAPSLQLRNVSDGGQTVELAAPPPSCPKCALLLLDVCSFSGVPQADVSNDCWIRLKRSDRYEPIEDTSHVQVTTFFAGWYRPLCCSDQYRCRFRGEPQWIEGLNVTTWNVSLSVVQQPDPPRLSVQFSQDDPSAPPGFYLPKFEVETKGPRSYRVSNYPKVDVGSANIRPTCFVGKDDAELEPGEYTITIRPQNGVTFNCEGNSDGCPLRKKNFSVVLLVTPDVSPVPGSPRDGLVYVAAVIAVGVVVSALLVGGGVRLARRQKPSLLQVPLPLTRPAPAPAATVLLLHRGATAAADRDSLHSLELALCAGGVTVLDLHRGPLLRLLHTYPSTADLLCQEPLRSARLLFLATGSAGGSACDFAGGSACDSASGCVVGDSDDSSSGSGSGSGGGGGGDARSVAAQVYDNILCHVRNGCLNLDYGRVFAARLRGAGTAQLAGLPEGRLFTLPEHVQLLLEHLTAARPTVEMTWQTETTP